MAICPKCGVKLKLTDIKPICPKCGINLIYYGMEERLLEDADKAESEHARMQKTTRPCKGFFCRLQACNCQNYIEHSTHRSAYAASCKCVFLGALLRG